MLRQAAIIFEDLGQQQPDLKAPSTALAAESSGLGFRS